MCEKRTTSCTLKIRGKKGIFSFEGRTHFAHPVEHRQNLLDCHSRTSSMWVCVYDLCSVLSFIPYFSPCSGFGECSVHWTFNGNALFFCMYVICVFQFIVHNIASRYPVLCRVCVSEPMESSMDELPLANDLMELGEASGKAIPPMIRCVTMFTIIVIGTEDAP